MMTSIRIHLQGIKVALATRMTYRSDFFISVFIMLLIELFSPIVTLLIYQNGASFPGWTIYEALLIQGVFLLSRGIACPFFFTVPWNVIESVRSGTFDMYLIKPRPVFHTAIVFGFDSEDLGKLIGGAAIFIFSVTHIPPPSLLQWLQFLGLFLVSLIIMFAFALILSGLGIVWVGNFRFYEILFAIINFGLYPASIFPKMLQIILAYMIPISMIGFMPATVLLGKAQEGMLLAVLSSKMLLIAGLWFWSRMLKRYTSSG